MAVYRYWGSCISTSTRMWSGRPPTKSSARWRAVTPGAWQANDWKRSEKSCTEVLKGRRPSSARRLPRMGEGGEPDEAQVVKALPRRHPALVLLEGVVPRLCGATEVVGGDPRAVGRQGSLPPEKLIALIEPVQGVDCAVVRGELQFGEARRLLPLRR